MRFIFFTFLIVFFVCSDSALARCYKVTGYRTPASNTTILPTEGVAGSWAVCDTCNGSLNLPSVLNYSPSPFQPYGTLLASSTVPFTTYGATAGYDPERVFIKCELADDVYEMYSTNGDNTYGGYCGASGTAAGDAIGLSYAYSTRWRNILLKLINVETGQPFQCTWQERVLTNLDVDETGLWKFVKAKNLSTIRAELYTVDNNIGVTAEAYTYTQPNAYIALKGPGFTGPTAGRTHSADITGYNARWPGTIGLRNGTLMRRSPTCSVTSATPVVDFSTVSINQMNTGGYVDVPFTVAFECSPGFVSGTAVSNTSIGFKASNAAVSHSVALGLVNSAGGLEYLVSDNYGQPGVAAGVGIKLLRNSVPIKFLTTDSSALGSANAASIGWYPVIGNATTALGLVNGLERFTEVFRARLQKLDFGTQPSVTPGTLNATAQVIIRVQ